MPLYEYECSDCASQAELLIRSDTRPTCPSCGSLKLTRLLSVPAVPMKADGSQLPMCMPTPASGCGLPQCGQGRCAGE